MINVPLFNSKEELTEFVEKNSKKTTVSIDNRDWFFTVAITNGKQRILLTKSSIQNLVIEEDLFTWYQKGYITVRNKSHHLERSTMPDKLLGKLGLSDVYKIRGDGRDLIYINISPKLDYFQSIIAKISGMDTKPDPDIYNLSNDYAIYETKTSFTEEEGEEYLTLYFWDLRYQLLTERNCHYSTGLVKSKEDKEMAKEIRMLNNKDRSIKSGKAIRAFIEEHLEDQKPKFDDENWDDGGTEIFYSSPAQYKGANDLDWLMNMHVSSDSADNDFSILKYDTYIDKWTLIPISKYFEKATKKDAAGEYQLDKFHISWHVGKPNIFMSLLGAKKKTPSLKLEDFNSKVKSKKSLLPIANKVGRKNINTGESTELETDSWNFSDLAGIDNQNLLTTYAVHSYNMGTHEFNIDVYKNELQTVVEKFQKDFIEKNFLGDPPTTSLAVTPNKKTRHVMNNMYELSNDEKIRQGKGRNVIYKNLIFLNNACSLTIKGETHRRCGRFFSLDRKERYFSNDYDEKILGQYFVVNVKHIFDGESYTNEVLGVKPYRFAEPEIELEKIIK